MSSTSTTGNNRVGVDPERFENTNISHHGDFIEELYAFNKDDIGKTMFSLIEPLFLEGIAEVLTEGAKKYGVANWKTIPKEEIPRYKDAMLRHINDYMKGKILDDDSHRNQMLHIACNAMFLYYFDTNIGKQR